LGSLGTDYVDLLLLHDPTPGSVRSEDVYAYLEDARRAGDIRTWGIAGEPVPTMEVARDLPGPVPVLQLRDDVFLRSLRSLQPTLASGVITFGALGRALSQLVKYVTADAERYRRWNAAIGADCGQPSIIAPLLLRDAFRENADGIVLFSTVYAERIHSAVTAAGVEPNRKDGELEAFRKLIQAESKDAYAMTKGRA
jgi:diketogulonate reductase-like aldo/keto reductase